MIEIAPAWLSAGLLGLTLLLFASDRVRPDLVAVIALLAAVCVGLVAPGDAFDGFGDSAVITVAAVLVIGRAVELSGVAAGLVRVLTPADAPMTVKLGLLLALGAVLSAFMNNIAALAITMPVMVKLCRDEGLSPGVGLMPLAFATILGGMTTLIGTPANLILSSVREEAVGTGFSFFAMTPVGAAATAAGLLYLVLIGWRLAPRRATGTEGEDEEPLRTFELLITSNVTKRYGDLRSRLREAEVSLLAVWRGHARVTPDDDDLTQPGDQLVVSARMDPWDAAKKVGLRHDQPLSAAPDAMTARLVVASGSVLVGLSYGAVEAQSDGDLRVVAGGPRAARERKPLRALKMQPGDLLFIQGSAYALAQYSRYARLLEISRKLSAPTPGRRAAAVLAIYVAAVVATAGFGVAPAVAFVAAAAVMAALRFIPPLEIYRAVDWPVIVLLAAMIPVGRSFADSGAAAVAAGWLTHALGDMSLFWALSAMALATTLFSMFLNNVATAIVMGPVAVQVAQALDAPVDAFLLAVLIGASSDFLTPIGHQNNLLVMGPGGYRFSDYPRIGALMLIIVIAVTAMVLSRTYG